VAVFVSSPVAQPLSDRVSMRRVFWLPLGLSAGLVIAVLAGLVTMSWHSLDRLQPLQHHLAHIARIQDVGLAMEAILLKGLRGARVDQAELERLGGRVREIAQLEGAMHPDTRQQLDLIARRIAHAGPHSVDMLFETLAQLRAVLASEREQHDNLLMSAVESTRMELRLAVLLLVVLPLGGGVALLLLQRRVEQPLTDLQNLLSRLSERDFRPVPDAVVKETARLARPALSSFNALVSRLQELEAEHQDRERTLERRVREATEALLAQSRELSRAERLAAVGAVSAGLAHELRNPLAGIQLACSNLQKKLSDAEQIAKITAVIGELKRVNHRLTEQVDAARHAPEPLVQVDFQETVGEVLELLRYQTPSNVKLKSRIDAGLQCVLPAAGLRQALLNLLLNAVQVQGDEGWIEIAVTREDSEAILRISDDGPGFPEEMLHAGIRPFATNRAGGTGLGLAMVRRFVRDLDGDLKLENRSPRGALVTLRLPCASADESGDETNA
jgi:two-component system NtrC family sensor kinase